MTNWFSREGSASPLGVTWIADEEAFNFALYSKYASEVKLLLYSRDDTTHPLYEYKFNPLINKSERVWHCRLKASAIAGARYYAYKISGPNEPGAGHRFDDQKILLDPYARSVYFPRQFSREIARMAGKQCGEGSARRACSRGEIRLGRRSPSPPHLRSGDLRNARSGIHGTRQFRRDLQQARYVCRSDRENSLSKGTRGHGRGAHAGHPAGPTGRRELGLHAPGILCATPRVFQRRCHGRNSYRIPKHGEERFMQRASK